MRILFLSCFFFLACFFLLSGHAFAADPFAIYLSWQQDPTTTMTVQWISSLGEEGDAIELETNGDKDEIQRLLGTHHPVPQDEPYLIHFAEIQNLAPDTLYHFRIPGFEKEYAFRTMPKDLSKPISFVVGGDTNQSDEALFPITCREAARQNPRFILFGGDLAYASPNYKDKPEDGPRWLRWIQNYSKTAIASDGSLIPLLVTIGNHDVKGHFNATLEDAPFFYALFAMPGPRGYNVLCFDDYMSLLLLDSGHTNPVKGAQEKWIDETLARVSRVPHCFVIYHVPAYPSVRSFNLKLSASIRKHWVPIFEKYHVSAAFENHDHVYKRSYPLIGGECDPNGVLFIGDGSWGVKPRVPKKPGKSESTRFLAKTLSTRQFLKVQISKTTREYWAITPEGQIVDHYVQLVKKPIEK
jgi:hypothetical protein